MYEIVARLILGSFLLIFFIGAIALSQHGSKRKWYKKKRFIIPLTLFLTLYCSYPETALILFAILAIPLLIYYLLVFIIFLYMIITGKDDL